MQLHRNLKRTSNNGLKNYNYERNEKPVMITTSKMNIVLMVRDYLPNGYLECCRGYRITEESQEVKVRLPLSLKT